MGFYQMFPQPHHVPITKLTAYQNDSTSEVHLNWCDRNNNCLICDH